ncbi:MAG: type II toxin-antitoxin system ParD family antitoxin [Bacteroidota bacterium]
MNVSLTPKLEALIKEKVDSGMYSNASEVVREALRAYFGPQATATGDAGELRKELLRGLEQLDHKEYGRRTLDEIFEAAKRRAERNTSVPKKEAS